MAVEYAKALSSQGACYEVIGRGNKSARLFHEQTGVDVVEGGLERFLSGLKGSVPQSAIIALPVDRLYSAGLLLIKAGVKRILIEKPGALYTRELEEMEKESLKMGAEVFIAYNRRFYASVVAAQKMIEEDGGPLTLHAEFTEWSHVIETLDLRAEIKNRWLIANSSHVLDLAFHLGGLPEEGTFLESGKDEIEWHPAAAVFAGAAKTTKGCLFTYSSNWMGPGRWRIEVTTKFRRFLLCPLESLQVMERGQLEFSPVALGELDENIKMGILEQVLAFLSTDDSAVLVDLSEHLRSTIACDQIGNYAS